MPPKRSASEMTGEIEANDPIQRRRAVEILKNDIQNNEDEIQRFECEVKKHQDLAAKLSRELLKSTVMVQERISRLEELKEEEMQLLAVQEQAESFRKKLLKAGKESLDRMVKDALNDVKTSLEKKRRKLNDGA